MKRVFFLTGATGLVGAYLLARWQSDPPGEVELLVRAPDAAAAAARVRDALRRAGGRAAPLPFRIHCGDLRRPRLGLAPADWDGLRGRVTDVVHAAADVAFGGRPGRARPATTNVDGTHRLLAFAEGGARFVHVSTAYVAGTCAGPFREADLDVGQSFRNDYECSKFEAEQAVRAACAQSPERLTVVRPSIVLGERGTARTLQFASLYRMLEVLDRLARRAPRAPIRFAYDPQATQNYVPVDLVARWLDHIVRHAACRGRTFHLASGAPLTNREMGELLAAVLPVRFAPLAPGQTAPDAVSRAFVRQAGDYLPYLAAHPRFAVDNRRTLPEGGVDFRIDAAFVQAMLAFGRQTNWGRAYAQAG